MAHVIERPRVFDDEHRNPLRFVIGDEQHGAEEDCRRIDDEERRVEILLVARYILIVRDIAEPFPDPCAESHRT